MSTDWVDVPSSATSVEHDDITVDATSGGVLLLAANAHRRSALIINTGSNPMRVTTDGTAPSASHGKLLPPGASLSLASPFCPSGAIKAIRQGGSNTSANASEVI